MSINFFELQYLITDSFYFEVTVHEHTYEQSAGICHQSFYEYIIADNTNSILSVSLITQLMMRHSVPFTELDIKNIKRILELSDKINYQDSLNEHEVEYLEEYIELVRNKYKELSLESE
ncbi:hypothetical protein ACFQZE_14140 [Paenibacillus sp. GCM10027627]|uniref:hypothetical protein n=1 Tax=unclassified Paenibacillus TaxID=185978 RepID=UPI00364004A9